MAGAEDMARVLLRHDELGERAEPDSPPVIVEAAPGGHAMEVAHVLNLRQLHEVVPTERHRIFDETAQLKPPAIERNIGLLAEVQHRPVGDQMLANRHGGHAVAVRRATSFGTARLKSDVDRFRSHLALPLDVPAASLDQILIQWRGAADRARRCGVTHNTLRRGPISQRLTAESCSSARSKE